MSNSSIDLAARRQATAVGAIAIPLWATLALFATWSGHIPPFQLLAMTFLVAGLCGVLGGALLKRDVWAAARQPPLVWLVGVGGLFGYHFFYFLAFRLAPTAAVEVNLLNYLWPLLIVVFSSFLPGERLTARLVLGALAGLAGTIVIVTGRGDGLQLDVAEAPGYLSGIAAALLWSSYSVLSRRISAHVPSDAVTGFCFATAVLSGLCHGVFETTVNPTTVEWIAALALGLGPVGLAFFVWDHGVKRGDIQLLGTLAYATPLVSTFILIAFGAGSGGPSIWLATALIVGGAVLASLGRGRG